MKTKQENSNKTDNLRYTAADQRARKRDIYSYNLCNQSEPGLNRELHLTTNWRNTWVTVNWDLVYTPFRCLFLYEIVRTVVRIF